MIFANPEKFVPVCIGAPKSWCKSRACYKECIKAIAVVRLSNLQFIPIRDNDVCSYCTNEYTCTRGGDNSRRMNGEFAKMIGCDGYNPRHLPYKDIEIRYVYSPLTGERIR